MQSIDYLHEVGFIVRRNMPEADEQINDDWIRWSGVSAIGLVECNTTPTKTAVWLEEPRA
jgi:hypothetical protein